MKTEIYSEQRKRQAYLEGQEAWNNYYESGFKPSCRFNNIYCKKKQKELWQEWNKGWNTNFKGGSERFYNLIA